VTVAQFGPNPSNDFQFNTSDPAGYTNLVVNSVQRACGVGNLTIEGNTVELAPAVSGELIGVHARDFWSSQDPTYPAYPFSKVIMRDNKIRYLDGGFSSSYVGYGTQFNSVGNLQVRNNVVDSAPANPLKNIRSGAVTYFNNLSPGGVLIQGLNQNTNTYYEELSTFAEFALVMGLFNRRS
jgi:hypothetical protein